MGYVLKDEALETLANAVRAAACGKSWLSPSVASQVIHRVVKQQAKTTQDSLSVHLLDNFTRREHEILCLLAEGLDNSSIAQRLTITKRTVQNHICNIYGKLGVRTRTEAMLYAIQHGMAQVT